MHRSTGGFFLWSIPRALREFNPEKLSIPSWNDDPKRTQAEVLAMVDRAIELEEAGR